MKLTPKISLEDAERVVKAHRDSETARKAQELRRFMGRFFRRQGDMDLILDHAESWVYAKPHTIAGADYPRVVGLTVRRFKSGVVIDREHTLDLDRPGWIEIEPDEFWGAAKLALAEATDALAPSEVIA